MTTIKLRRGTAAEWTAANTVLGDGEPGFERDTGRYKIGDGVTAWSSLDYFLPQSDLADLFAPKGAVSSGATPQVAGTVRLAGDLGGVGSTSELPRISDNAITSAKLSATVRNQLAAIATKADLVSGKVPAAQLPASRSIVREVFGQEGDAVETKVGHYSISNFARKPLPLWKVSNDNVLSPGKATTARLFYFDQAGNEQVIPYDLVIPAGAYEAVHTIPTELLPTISAGKEFGVKATVAPASSTGAEQPVTFTVGTPVDTGDVLKNELDIPIPDAEDKVGKPAIVIVVSSNGLAAMPSVSGGGPTWTTLKSRVDTNGSLSVVAAVKPIVAGETSYKVTFAGLYASVGVVIVLDSYNDLAMFDNDYVVEHTVDTFTKNPGNVVGDSTTGPLERIFNIVATRNSAAEYPQVVTNTIPGVTKIVEESTARPTLANVHLTVFTQVKDVAGPVVAPTVQAGPPIVASMSSPFNSRWLLFDLAASSAEGELLVGAFNLTVHGESEVLI